MTVGIEKLEKLYKDCRAYHGEMHDHSNSGGTSDGKQPLSIWIKKLEELKMDFAAILDHRQIRHMYQPEWKDGLFIAGTEPGTSIVDSKAEVQSLHYNIILPERDLLAPLLASFPEYEFTGGIEGHFVYPTFTTARFRELIQAIKDRGGMFVHPHPTIVMKSDDPLDYWFCDETGIEVFYNSMDSEITKANYELWCKLLKAGKRVWACAGCDEHNQPSDKALTTIYAEEKTGACFLKHLSKGDFTCGPVGIRMCIGETVTGGHCTFGQDKLVIAVSDFHESVHNPQHSYRLDLLNDRGLVCSQKIECDQTFIYTMETEECAFYRAELFDETLDLRIAIGNPIWNNQK